MFELTPIWPNFYIGQLFMLIEANYDQVFTYPNIMFGQHFICIGYNNDQIWLPTQLTIKGCSNVSTTVSESCENVFQKSYANVATTLSGNVERKWGNVAK